MEGEIERGGNRRRLTRGEGATPSIGGCGNHTAKLTLIHLFSFLFFFSFLLQFQVAGGSAIGREFTTGDESFGRPLEMSHNDANKRLRPGRYRRQTK